MARTDARLELRKARKATAALELNPLLVVRYVAVLQGTSLPPSLACSPGLVLPAVLQGQSAAPDLATAPGLIHPGHLTAELAAPVAFVSATVVIEATLASTTRAVLHDFEAGYDINVYRGPSHTSAGDWDRAALVTTAVASDWQRPALTPATCRGDWQEAVALMAVVVDLCEQLPRHHEPVRGLFDEALPLNASHGQGFDSLPPGHAVTRSLWVEGAPVSRWQVNGYRNPPRQDKVWQPGSWQQGAPQGATLSGQQWQLGLPLHKGWLERWEEAMQPPWGTSPPPKPPIKPERPDKRTKVLAFGRQRADARLEFVWYPDHTVVIPTRRVYFVINSATIKRLSDGMLIPAETASIELDADSWAWQFSAQLPLIEHAQAADNQEIEILINGHRWVFKAEKWSDTSAFNQQSATISGRSLTAYLSSSYVVPASDTEANARTMAQLAEQQLPTGWTLDWQAANWLVPGNTWTFENETPISAIQRLAEAAGAFVRPDMAAKAITVKPRYPALPWHLASTAPDVVIPHSIMVTKGRQRDRGKQVNGVWVDSGGNVLGPCLVKRQGSGADRLLPAQMNPLMVDTDGIRAFGSALLAEAGPRSDDDIELPLSEDTGLLLPGLLAATPDGKGYVRGIRVTATWSDQGGLDVTQSINIERPEV